MRSGQGLAKFDSVFDTLSPTEEFSWACGPSEGLKITVVASAKLVPPMASVLRGNDVIFRRVKGEGGSLLMRIKAVICNCKGLSPSFKKSDMNTLPFEIESDLDVDYAVVHPQLCGMGGNRVMEDALRSVADDPETFVIVGACGAEAQLKLFQKLFRKTGFNQDHFLPVDIRGATNREILERLGERLRERLQLTKRHG